MSGAKYADKRTDHEIAHDLRTACRVSADCLNELVRRGYVVCLKETDEGSERTFTATIRKTVEL